MHHESCYSVIGYRNLGCVVTIGDVDSLRGHVAVWFLSAHFARIECQQKVIDFCPNVLIAYELNQWVSC